MKNRRLNLILLAILVIFFAAGSAMASTIELKTTSTTVRQGSTFDVQVWADGEDIGEDLLSFGFDVSVIDNGDGDNLSYEGYTMGGYFDDGSLFAGLDVAGDALPAVSDDDVLLATLTFTAVSIGTDTISISGVYDEQGLSFAGLLYEVSGFDIGGSIDITVGAVPEPGTIFLMCTGLITFLGVSRKKNMHI